MAVKANKGSVIPDYDDARRLYHWAAYRIDEGGEWPEADDANAIKEILGDLETNPLDILDRPQNRKAVQSLIAIKDRFPMTYAVECIPHYLESNPNKTYSDSKAHNTAAMSADDQIIL
jgi:hypothetical protein